MYQSLLFSGFPGSLNFCRICFQDYLEVTTSVIVLLGVGRTYATHRYSVDIFLTESRIPLYSMLGTGELLHLLLILMNRPNKTKSPVFRFCRFSQFLKYLFSKLFR